MPFLPVWLVLLLCPIQFSVPVPGDAEVDSVGTEEKVAQNLENKLADAASVQKELQEALSSAMAEDMQGKRPGSDEVQGHDGKRRLADK